MGIGEDLSARLGIIVLVLLFACLPLGRFLGVPSLYVLGTLGALGLPLLVVFRPRKKKEWRMGAPLAISWVTSSRSEPSFPRLR
jgi:hypothetical protein